MPTKKPKQKQKQKQKQRQTVIVNVNQRASTRRRGTPRRTRGGGGGGIPYPVYLNSPNDYAPIIHNVLPSTLQASIPTNTMLSTPLVNTVPIPHIPASKLQTNDEVNIPLIKKITRPSTPPRKAPPMGSLAEQILAEHAKRAKKKETPIQTKIPEVVVKQQSPLIAEVQQKISSPNKGLRPSPMPKIFEPPTSSPFQSALQGEISSREVRQSPSGIIRPIPVRGRPVQFTDEQKAEKVKYNNTQEGKREMAERQMFAKEDPKSSKFFR